MAPCGSPNPRPSTGHCRPIDPPSNARAYCMSSLSEDLLDELPGDEPSVRLNGVPYARKVVRLLQLPNALDRWRARCRESYQELCRRQAQLALWNEERARFLFWSRR